MPNYLKILSKYVENNNILSPSQSVFMQEYSTTSALLKLTNVYIALDSGDLTGDIFIYLKKAFVLVDHVLLLDKLYVGFSQFFIVV